MRDCLGSAGISKIQRLPNGWGCLFRLRLSRSRLEGPLLSKFSPICGNVVNWVNESGFKDHGTGVDARLLQYSRQPCGKASGGFQPPISALNPGRPAWRFVSKKFGHTDPSSPLSFLQGRAGGGAGCRDGVVLVLG